MLDQLLQLKNEIGDKKQVSDTIYTTLKEGMATGILKPGFRLKEEELADKFSVSRTPVRESIKRLEYEGLVTTDSTHGSIIKQIELAECLDTLEMLEWLRDLSITLVNSRIPRSILMMIEANLRKGEKLTDVYEQYENNVEFHALIIRATGNTELIKITKRLEFIERTIVNNVVPYHFADDYVAKHRELLMAILDNNTEYIESYSKENQELSRTYMNQVINQYLNID